jgi:hypothetical protein
MYDKSAPKYKSGAGLGAVGLDFFEQEHIKELAITSKKKVYRRIEKMIGCNKYAENN